jgi:hypothetical protein
MKKNLMIVAIIVFTGLLPGSFIYYLYYLTTVGELGDKDAYAMLQSIEIENRDAKPIESPIVIKNAYESSYTLLRIPSGNEKYSYVWIILNRVTHDGSVFKMPSTPTGVVSCRFVEELAIKIQINDPVLRYLRSICKNSPVGWGDEAR